MAKVLDTQTPPSGFGMQIQEPWLFEPVTHNTGAVVDRGDATAPVYGPGYDDSAGDGRPVLHDLTFGVRDQGAWSEDHMTGVTALVNPLPADHSGYQEPWGPDVTTPRNAPVAAWDAGITVGAGAI